jgi:potassium-dependent mechanosensitive channel
MLFDKLTHLTKRQMFGVIIGIIAVIGLIISIVTNITLITRDDDDAIRFAVVGPMSGDSANIGKSMRQGVELYFDLSNGRDELGGSFLKADVYDDKNDPAEAVKIAEKIAGSNARAAIGHWTTETARAAGKVYDEKGIQLVVPTSIDPGVIKENDWVFSSLFSDTHQARFLANYARNVLGHKLVSMIVDKKGFGETLGNNFRDTYRRFGTKIRYTWEYDSGDSVVKQMVRIVEELKGYKDAGAIFLAMNEIDGARMIKLIRDAGIRNVVIGPNYLATQAFFDAIKELPGDSIEYGRYTNRMLVTAPLLFDTANETAQNFKNNYIEKYGEAPDWVAAYAYDTAHMLVQGLKSATADEEAADNLVAVREGIKLDLAGRLRTEEGIQGVSGNTFFSEEGEAQKPAFIGIYSGADIVSALTQLQPIKPGGNRNFISELKRGRVLYVNDRFMYKTNVVYTGLQVNEVSEIKRAENQFQMDFLIWFRYRGDFEPQDLKFINAVEPIKLEDPVDEQKIGDMTYRLYRVKGNFRFNFSDTYRVYGDHLVGVAFSHNTLNKNNLQYVVDVLGVALKPGETMRNKLEQTRAVKPASGFVIDRAWISQDIVPEGTLGNPAYVGFAADEPEFSQIDLGIIIQKGEIKIRDFIPAEFFIYIAIFALVGMVFAVGMDRRERGRFWAAQSWFLRLVSWPAMLLSTGNLALDFATQNLPEHYIDIMILVYELLWWLIPARIFSIALERFLWTPLEDHTERAIPNVIRVFGSVIVYTFAGCGIVAFVFDQHLTSLLATGGLMTMIIGLAVQSNIANIFSGIVINMERPFNVGDWVQIGDLDEGRVVDITWRTTRVKVRNGYVVSLPNGQVSEAQIHNFNSFDAVRLELALYLDARFPMMATSDIMEAGLMKAPNILDTPEREVRFKGIDRQYNVWVAEYEIQFWIENYGRREEISEAALSSVWDELAAHGIRPFEDNPDTTVIENGAAEADAAGE